MLSAIVLLYRVITSACEFLSKIDNKVRPNKHTAPSTYIQVRELY